MLKIFSLLGVLLVSLTPKGVDQSNLILAGSGSRNVAVTFSQQADYVSIPVSISSWAANSAAPAKAKQKAVDAIVSEAEKQPDIIILKKPPAQSLPPASESSGKSCLLNKKPEAVVYLLVRLRGTDRDITACTEMIHKFLLSVPLPEKTKLHFYNYQLASENPEQYRPKVLAMISEELARIQQNFSRGKVAVTGLEKPVLVRQADEDSVEYFIDYQISFGQ